MTWDIAGNENVLGVAKHLYTTMFMNYSTIAAGTFCFSTSIYRYLFFSKTKNKIKKNYPKVGFSFQQIFNIQ